MPAPIGKIISGLLAGIVCGLAGGFLLGIVTMFIGAIPGALVGFALGFRWGYRRVGAGDDGSTSWGRTGGDTAILLGTGTAALWLTVAVGDLLFGYSAPYRGHPFSLFVIPLALILAPVAGILVERQARKHLTVSERDVGGISGVVLLVLMMTLWWHWAEARDAATSQYRVTHPQSVKRR